MSYFDNDILVENVCTLMRNNRTTQEELGAAIEMSQPNINKALKRTDGKRFTLEQVYNIANYYGVSIDWLMGNQSSDAVPMKAIGEFITKLVSSGIAKITEISVEEIVYEKYDCDAVEEKRKTTYPAVYFPNYWNPYEISTDDDDTTDAIQNAERCGNDTGYWYLNSYLSKLYNYYGLMKKSKIDEEDFQTLTQKHLNNL